MVSVAAIQLCPFSRRAAADPARGMSWARCQLNFLYRRRRWVGFDLLAAVCSPLFSGIPPVPQCS